MEQKMVKNVNNTEKIFAQRMEKHQDELRWLYMELYGNDAMYAELCEQIHDYYLKRSTELKKRDIKKEKNPDWFKEKEMLGMMLYIDNFAGNLKGVEKKLAYLKECNVNCLHLMPFLDTPEGRSDGGYAVADFRKVRPDLGTMKDLAELAEKCHEEDINVCMEHDDSVLCILREYKGRRFFGIFIFSDQEKTAWMQEDGVYRNLLTSEKMELKDIRLRGYDFLWCEK